MTSRLIAEGRRILSALKPAQGVEVELFLSAGRSRDVGWGEGKPKDVLSSDSGGMSVRVIDGGRQGFASANDRTPERARALFEQALATSALLSPDEHRRLAAPAKAAPLTLPFEKALFRKPVKTLQGVLKRLEKETLLADPRIKKVLSLSFHEGEGGHAVLNTRGVAVEDWSTGVSFSLEMMGESNGETHAAWDWSESSTWAKLDVASPLAAARRRLLGAFGAGSLPSGVMPVLFEARTGVDILELLAGALSGEAVQKERSFLAGLIGKAVASTAVTLVDDGRLPRGLGSARYDDEGVPTRRTPLVSKGVLKAYYYDTASAAKAGAKSTGNAGRPGHAAGPAPETSNFFMAPGRLPAAKLFAQTPKAFVVQELLGMHTADPVSGDFSVGASGYLWEGGRAVRAVKGVTLAGTLTDLLKKVDAVAADLTWRGATGCPTFRVSGLSIGGA